MIEAQYNTQGSVRPASWGYTTAANYNPLGASGLTDVHVVVYNHNLVASLLHYKPTNVLCI